MEVPEWKVNIGSVLKVEMSSAGRIAYVKL